MSDIQSNVSGFMEVKVIRRCQATLNVSFMLWFLAKIIKRQEVFASDISSVLSLTCALLLISTVGLSLKLFNKFPALGISILSMLPVLNFFVIFYLNYKAWKKVTESSGNAYNKQINQD